MQTETQPTSNTLTHAADTYDQLAAYMSAATTPTIVDPDDACTQAQIPTALCAVCNEEWPCAASEVELQAPGTSPFGALHRPEVYDARFMAAYRANHSSLAMVASRRVF